MKQNAIVEQSMAFAVRIVRLYLYLCREKREFVMARQLLKSGTSIGANVREAIYGQTRKDFIAKLSIALKETSETEYWLELLYRTGFLTSKQYQSIQQDCSKMARILTAIVKTSKARSGVEAS